MKRYTETILALCLVLSSAACSAPLADVDTSADRAALAAAFTTLPPGYNEALNSFPGGPDVGWPDWHGPMSWSARDGSHRSNDSVLMGGGLGDLFVGAGSVRGFGRRHHHGGLLLGFGRGLGHWPFGDGWLDGDCEFNAGSGRVECTAVTRRGLTIERSIAYATEDGTVQQAYDSISTNTINTRIAVNGTITRRDSSVTTVQSTSDRTISGLKQGSSQRTINGTSAGHESTTGSNDRGAYTFVRTAGDTTRNMIVPVKSDSIRYPMAGTVIRSMQVTVTYAGEEPVTSSRREVVTYDGSNQASVVITKNGETRTCTMPLPRGRLTCS
jgi:hypothetical protein